MNSGKVINCFHLFEGSYHWDNLFSVYINTDGVRSSVHMHKEEPEDTLKATTAVSHIPITEAIDLSQYNTKSVTYPIIKLWALVKTTAGTEPFKNKLYCPPCNSALKTRPVYDHCKSQKPPPCLTSKYR